VALDFPELVIVGGHIGYPWTDEAIAVTTKHETASVAADVHELLKTRQLALPHLFCAAFVEADHAGRHVGGGRERGDADRTEERRRVERRTAAGLGERARQFRLETLPGLREPGELFGAGFGRLRRALRVGRFDL